MTANNSIVWSESGDADRHPLVSADLPVMGLKALLGHLYPSAIIEKSPAEATIRTRSRIGQEGANRFLITDSQK